MKILSTSDFFNNQFASFAEYDCYRNITNVIDGFKLSQRKVAFTVDDKNINSPIKVESLAPEVGTYTEYLHGAQSLYGVIIGMASPWGIWNNLPLLSSKGNFGSRMNGASAAPRYIFTYKQKVFDYIFRKEDRIILKQLNFEGHDIEYNHYLPIIPYSFCKISEGMGTGFSHLVMPRNPVDLIKNVILMLDGKKPKELKAYAKGFKGNISKTKDGSWQYEGTFERKGKNHIIITELPIGYDLTSYNKVLNELEDKKVIKSFKDVSDAKKDTFKFELDVTQEFSDQSDGKILSELKLIDRIGDNLTFLNENNQIIQFDNDIEIQEYWFKYRLSKYNERKSKYIELLEEKLKVIKNKFRFIQSIIDDKIVVNKKSKVDIIDQLERNGFDLIDDSYDYLLNMPIYSLTFEKMSQLEDEMNEMDKELQDYKNTDVKDIWRSELDELEKVLK